MLTKLSNKITLFFIKKGYVNSDQEDVYNYCFEILISTVMNLIAIIIIAVSTGLYLESLTFAIAFMTLRGYCGGYHAKRHITCFLSLMAIYGVMCAMTLVDISIIKYISMGCITFGTVVLLCLSPVEAVNKPLSKDESARLRIKAIIFIIIFASGASTMMFFEETIKYAFVIGYVLTALSGLLIIGLCANARERYKLKFYPKLSVDDDELN